eukprot:GHVU01048790.1.p1 GENE.GHVU01048790.1~~GHVU01048790.1.p1  ORF type:complete len:409 (+),score=27.76 GHVU01048790.1:765-1991(+)
MGCYDYSAGAPHLPKHASPDITSVRACQVRCLAFGYKFFGIANQVRCYCGDVFGNTGRVADSNCDLRCGGDKPCGGVSSMSIYSNIDGLQQLGCAVASGGANDLNSPRTSGHTQLTCAHDCAAAGYPYGGIIKYDECVCGASYIGGGPTTCTETCKREEERKCGGDQSYAAFGALVTPLLGCYSDSSGGPQQLMLYAADDATYDVGSCSVVCRRHGFTFAAVTAGQHCHCSSVFPSSAALRPIGECSTPCVSERSKLLTCGGPARSQIYDIGARHVGCFNLDTHFSASMNQMADAVANSYVSCRAVCADSGFSLMGLAGSSCYCGSSFASSGYAGGRCPPCQDSNLGCGVAGQFVSVYKITRGVRFDGTGMKPPPPTTTTTTTTQACEQVCARVCIHVNTCAPAHACV